MITSLLFILAGLVLFGALLACIELANRRAKRDDVTGDGYGHMESAVFALLGLILAFVFSGAQGRLESRRNLAVEEANAIGTAYLQLDLLPADSQPEMRRRFIDYIDSRLTYNQSLSFGGSSDEATAASNALQTKIWAYAIQNTLTDDQKSTRVILLPSLNHMFDMAASRRIATSTHVPTLVVILMLGLAIAGALLAGRAAAKSERPSWPRRLIFCAVVAGTICVVSDLEYPRSGLIRADSTDVLLRELKDSIKI